MIFLILSIRNSLLEHGYPSVITSSKASLKTPLLFEPGTQWEYGSNIDSAN